MLGIYGLSCRIQRLALTRDAVDDGEAREQLWMAAARNAETSYEDLGLDYDGVTHAALYDDMARSFVPSDAWLMEENGLPAALEFKRWVYERMIVDDIPTASDDCFRRSTTTPNTRWLCAPSPSSSTRTMTSPRRRRSGRCATSARTSATRRR